MKLTLHERMVLVDLIDSVITAQNTYRPIWSPEVLAETDPYALLEGLRSKVINYT